MIVRVSSVVLRTVVGVDHHHSDDGYRSGCRNVSQHQQQSSGLHYNPDDRSNHNIDSPGFKPFTVVFVYYLYLCVCVSLNAVFVLRVRVYGYVLVCISVLYISNWKGNIKYASQSTRRSQLVKPSNRTASSNNNNNNFMLVSSLLARTVRSHYTRTLSTTPALAYP